MADMDRNGDFAVFDRLADFYYANKEEIDTGHEGRYVLLYRSAVAGYFRSWDEAEIHALRHGFKGGEFLIHRCDLNEQPEFYVSLEESLI